MANREMDDNGTKHGISAENASLDSDEVRLRPCVRSFCE